MKTVWKWPLGDVTVDLAAFAVARELMVRRERRADEGRGDSFLTTAEDRVIEALVAYFGAVRFGEFAATVDEQQQCQQGAKPREVS